MTFSEDKSVLVVFTVGLGRKRRQTISALTARDRPCERATGLRDGCKRTL